MQIRRENIVGIIIPVAVSFALYLLQNQVKNMSYWVFYIGYSICGLTILGSILALTPIWDRFFNKKSVTKSVIPISDTGLSYKNILKIKHIEPSIRPPKILEVYLFANYMLMLAFAGLAIYLLIEGKIVAHIGWEWIIFFLVFLALPIWAMIDFIFIERKQRKLGKSRTAKENEIVLYGDINNVFDMCLKALNKMNTSPITMDKPKIFKGFHRSFLGNAIITLKISQMKDQKIKINVMSDAQWVTVKWDIFNVNQRNANTFERLIRSDLSHLNKEDESTK